MADPQLGLIALQLRSGLVLRAPAPPPPTGLCTASGLAVHADDFTSYADYAAWVASSSWLRSIYSAFGAVDGLVTIDSVLPVNSHPTLRLITSNTENYGFTFNGCFTPDCTTETYADAWLRTIWNVSADFDAGVLPDGSGLILALFNSGDLDETIWAGVQLTSDDALVFWYSTDSLVTQTRVNIGPASLVRGIGPVDCLLHWETLADRDRLTFYLGQSCPPVQLGTPLDLPGFTLPAGGIEVGLINNAGTGSAALGFIEIIDGTAHPNPYAVV